MTARKPLGRLHSKDPADAAWRARQAEVDADIEGLARDAGIDRFFDEMEASGVAPRERIKRLKAYLRVRQSPRPTRKPLREPLINWRCSGW
jgi:hypothetical protein